MKVSKLVYIIAQLFKPMCMGMNTNNLQMQAPIWDIKVQGVCLLDDMINNLHVSLT